jgi:small subunit ribosomal protein S21
MASTRPQKTSVSEAANPWFHEHETSAIVWKGQPGAINDCIRDHFLLNWLITATSGIMKVALWQVWRWDSLAEVRLQEGEPLENALRRFKRKVQQEDIIKEVKRHSYYLKPGEKRRVKAALARKRNRKKARKEQD